MSVMLEGKDIFVPQIQGNPNVFTSPIFFFVKPKWLPDESSSICPLCLTNFTTLRRKHHCRHCGRVICGKCCAHREPLPQFALDEPQRVCNTCRDVAELVAKARSQFVSHRQAAATGLVSMLQSTEDIKRMVAGGGMQTLISLTSQGDLTIWGAVASGSQHLAQHFSLHQALLDTGVIQAVFHLMSTVQSSNEQLLLDCLTTLGLFYTNKACINKVLELSDLGSVEELLFSSSGAVSLLAIKVLHKLSSHLNSHYLVFQRSCSLLSNVLKVLKNEDTQMQAMALSILILFSAGSEQIRHRIILEDCGATGCFLLAFLKGVRTSSECYILQNALCLLANLASSINAADQAYLQVYISPTLDLLGSSQTLPITTLPHLARALANFSEYPANSLALLKALPQVVSSLLRSNSESSRLHACRLIISLIRTEPSATIEILAMSGVEDFLETVFSVPGVSDLVVNSFLKSVSKLSSE